MAQSLQTECFEENRRGQPRKPRGGYPYFEFRTFETKGFVDGMLGVHGFLDVQAYYFRKVRIFEI